MSLSAFSAPSWFDLHRYADVARLDFEGWRTQIGNRVYLASLLAGNMEEQFDQHFSVLQDSPFMDLGFADSYASGSAVYPLTYGVAQAMVSTLAPLSPHRKDSCDQKLQDDGQDSFGMHAHLTIDFHASEREITEAFTTWLKLALNENRQRFPRSREWGITTSVIDSWAKFQILPYQDLMLWHKRSGQELPSATILSGWLYAEQDGDKDKVLETEKKAKSAFTLAILRQLAVAAEKCA